MTSTGPRQKLSSLSTMHIGLCLEQTLGHRAHSANLAGAFGSGEDQVDLIRVEYTDSGRMPWAFRGSLQAARHARASARHDVRFFHTQSVALFAPFVARGRPFVVSVDATPKQIDEMGRWYAHDPSSGIIEGFKERWYRGVFARADALVAWSNWAASSLVADYGADASRIHVIHPGAPAQFFGLELGRARSATPTVLFVGGDLSRKGGDLLVDAFSAFRGRARLVLVTPASIAASDDIEVIGNAKPGSPELIDAYRRADVFCLPTRGDCTPLVLGEAMAAGLPVITTRIGSNAETVTDGFNGMLVDVDDLLGLRRSLGVLIDSAQVRAVMAAAARATAVERFDSEANAARILAVLRSVC